MLKYSTETFSYKLSLTFKSKPCYGNMSATKKVTLTMH